MRRASLLLACTLVAFGCSSSTEPLDYGDPTSLAVQTEQDGIVAWLVAPEVSRSLDTATPELVIGAYTRDDPRKPLWVEISRLEKDGSGVDQIVDLRRAASEGEPGPTQRFRLETPLTHGTNRLLVRVEAQDHTRVRRLAFALDYQGESPGVTLSVAAPTPSALLEGDPCSETRPIRASVTNARRVCVRGRITTLGSVDAKVSLGISGFAPETPKLDDRGQFEVALALPENRAHVIAVEVVDDAQRMTQANVGVVQDARPPSIEITSKARETSNASLVVDGTAKDAYGIDSIAIETQGGGFRALGATSPFSADVKLGFGENPITIVATDLAGNEARTTLSLMRTRTLWLGEPKRDTGATPIEVDRFDLDELLTPENQAELELVNIELLPAVKKALERIREPERFGVDTSEWGDAERNLQRILEMTPDTADLTGTSMEELLTIANAVGLPAPRILAELLDIGVTDYIVRPDITAEVLVEKLVGTHPNVIQDPATGAYVISVSMFDVFQDMQTLGPRFGPSGAHPGFLGGASFSEVLEPGFLLTLPVQSKLVQYDGVDLTRASKDFLFLLEGDRALDFNILEDDFVLVGLADEPVIDLRFTLNEHPGPNMLVAGATREAAPDADYPGFFRGDGQGYSVAPWFFEQSAVETGYRMFARSFMDRDYKRTLRYDAGSIVDAAVVDWDKGWVTITTAGGIGAPPPPLYAWDLLMEIAQVRLHDEGLSEGEANMAFSLEDLPIGLTAEQLIEKLRPKLAEQERRLSELFVGDLGLAESRTDVFYVPADGAEGALLFRAASDSEGELPYTKPGFFADSQLTDKVSTTLAVGGVDETLHEKIAAALGSIVYAEDESGRVYRIEIAARDGRRVGLHVNPVEDIR